MIYGIGLDLQQIAQIDAFLAGKEERHLLKIFTPAEIAYCGKHHARAQHFAGRWAVKEAYLKAVGTGLSGGVRFTDIETIRLPSGQPQIVLHGRAFEYCRAHRLRAFVSITHSGEYAAAQVVLVGRSDDDGCAERDST